MCDGDIGMEGLVDSATAGERTAEREEQGVDFMPVNTLGKSILHHTLNCDCLTSCCRKRARARPSPTLYIAPSCLDSSQLCNKLLTPKRGVDNYLKLPPGLASALILLYVCARFFLSLFTPHPSTKAGEYI